MRMKYQLILDNTCVFESDSLEEVSKHCQSNYMATQHTYSLDNFFPLNWEDKAVIAVYYIADSPVVLPEYRNKQLYIVDTSLMYVDALVRYLSTLNKAALIEKVKYLKLKDIGLL